MQKGIHYIFIADTGGMASAYPTLKERLTKATHHHITLIYCSADNQYLFQKELEILQKHFPTQLFVIYHSNALTAPCDFKPDDVEAIVNANTMQQMRFIISGNKAFVVKITEFLTFLGIEDIQIHEQYFSE